MGEVVWYRYGPVRNALISATLILAFFLMARPLKPPEWLEAVVYLSLAALGGFHWMKEAVEETLKEREININLLMLVAVLGLALLRVWEEIAVLSVLYGAAEGLEEYAFLKTRLSVRELLDLTPKVAHVIRDGKEMTVRVEELRVGDVFIVRPGESVPTDGVVIKGHSLVDESSITGESELVEKREGSLVFAGTMNHEGALEVKAIATHEENSLAKIVHLIEEAQEKKSNTQILVERFGRIYSPLVLLGALALLVVPTLFGGSLAVWARRAIVFLVAASPCALVISTPITVIAAVGRAGRLGVLVKGGMHLENLGKVKVVAVDKTGTLTKGKPIVTGVVAFRGREDDVLRKACLVEKYSNHPLAKAICERAGRVCEKEGDIADFRSLFGYGAVARVNGTTYYVGKIGLFKKAKQRELLLAQLENFKAEGKTLVFVGTEEEIDGAIVLEDELRPDAREFVRGLREMGVETVMLTGDNEATAKAIAEKVGIKKVMANLKPEEKQVMIKRLREEYGVVAMVGDGVNDAPALAEADVGIALKTIGVDVAVETADVAIVGDDLTKVVQALEIGKKARRITIQNLFFSAATLAILVPLAIFGTLSITSAVVLHEVSELVAVLNGLRANKS